LPCARAPDVVHASPTRRSSDLAGVTADQPDQPAALDPEGGADPVWPGLLRRLDRQLVLPPLRACLAGSGHRAKQALRIARSANRERKSTRLNSSNVKTSYAACS